MLSREYSYDFSLCQFQFSPVNSEIFYDTNKDQILQVSSNGTFIIFGGFWDGRFALYQLNNEKTYYFYTDSCVTSLKISDNDKIVYVGTMTGRLYIYYFENNNLELVDIKTDHLSEAIVYVHVDDELNILLSASNKYLAIYKLPSNNLQRVVDIYKEKSKKETISFALTSSSPMPSLVAYSPESNMFYAFSINGNLIVKKPAKYKDILSPRIVKDAYFNDHLMYSSSSFGIIIVSSLPYFNNSHTIILDEAEIKDSINNMINPLKCYEISRKNDIIYFWQFNDLNISVIK